jgi:hypothetical protein
MAETEERSLDNFFAKRDKKKKKERSSRAASAAGAAGSAGGSSGAAGGGPGAGARPGDGGAAGSGARPSDGGAASAGTAGPGAATKAVTKVRSPEVGAGRAIAPCARPRLPGEVRGGRGPARAAT